MFNGQEEKLRKYVTFEGIRKDSNLRYQERILQYRLHNRQEGEDKEFEFRHLLDVVIGNRSYIYYLDEQVEKGHEVQIDLYESTD